MDTQIDYEDENVNGWESPPSSRHGYTSMEAFDLNSQAMNICPSLSSLIRHRVVAVLLLAAAVVVEVEDMMQSVGLGWTIVRVAVAQAAAVAVAAVEGPLVLLFPHRPVFHVNQVYQMNFSSTDDKNDSQDSFSGSDDDDETIDVARKTVKRNGAVACMLSMYYEATFMNKTKRPKPVENVEYGYDWVIRTMNDPVECYNMFRMSKELILQLHDLLVASYGLMTSKKMSSLESLCMFLWMVGAPQSVTQAKIDS